MGRLADVSVTLDTGCRHGPVRNQCGMAVIAFEPRFVRTTGGCPSVGLNPCLRAAGNTGDGAPCVAYGTHVRRLTPRECERLQGLPDDWTLIPWRGKPGDKCPDGPRYKAVGNGQTVQVMEWLALRIKAALERGIEER